MTNFTAYSGLYRVWVPLRDDGQSPLISIWIDPYLRAFESSAEENSADLETVHRVHSVKVPDSTDAHSIFPRAGRSPGTEPMGI